MEASHAGRPAARQSHRVDALKRVLVVGGVLAVGCSDGITDSRTGPITDVECAPTAVASATVPDLSLELVESGLRRPTSLAFAPGDPRLFITEQFYGVRVVEPDGTAAAGMFIDLEGEISTEGERGVLGLAFAPDFESSRFLYLTYTDPTGDLLLTRWEVAADWSGADLQNTLLVVPQPTPLHQGGQIAFGPDGMLYVGLGDGGFPPNAQDPENLLGTLLRLDVVGQTSYRIPSDNPFVTQPGGREEVWAYGLRNPWSFSFDEPGGCLYIADVGEAHREEVNAVRSDIGGLNFGWDIMEGFDCFQDMGDDCDKDGLVLPFLDYPTGQPCGAVIGGHVYRGSEIGGLEGAYLYADLCHDWLRAFRIGEEGPVQEAEWILPDLDAPVHIARDPSGEIYILGLFGTLHRLVSP